MRRTYTDLQNDFPSFSFEKTFTEEDELWTPIRESDTHLDIRVRDVLDRVFESDDSLCKYGSCIGFFEDDSELEDCLVVAL